MHPTRFAAEYRERHNRLSVLFRIVLIIPHAFVLMAWGIAAFLTLIVAWFALVLTGRYPRGLYDFHAGFLRQSAAYSGYAYLLDDRFPPISNDPDYSTRLLIGPPQESYSRLMALFRGLLYIPVYVIAYALGLVAMLGAFCAWWVELFTGKLPRGLYDMTVLGVSYQTRSYAYLFMLDDQFPPFLDNAADEQVAAGPQHGGGLPVSPSSPTAAAPAAPESMAQPAQGTGLSGGDPLAR